MIWNGNAMVLWRPNLENNMAAFLPQTRISEFSTQNRFTAR